MLHFNGDTVDSIGIRDPSRSGTHLVDERRDQDIDHDNHHDDDDDDNDDDNDDLMILWLATLMERSFCQKELNFRKNISFLFLSFVFDMISF